MHPLLALFHLSFMDALQVAQEAYLISYQMALLQIAPLL